MSQVLSTPKRGTFQDNGSLASNTSIFELLKTLQGSGELEQSIYSEWESLLEKLDFTVASRNTNDEWFKTCSQLCGKKKKRNDHEASNDDEKKLYEEFKTRLALQKERETDFVVQLKLKEQESKLQSQTAEVWIRRAHQCLVEETKLIEKYQQICKETVKVKEPCEQLYYRLVNKEKILNGKLEKVETEVRNFRASKESYLRLAEQIQNVQDLVDAQGGMKNGIQSLFQQGNTLTQNAKEDIDQSIQEFWTAVQDLQPIFNEVYEDSKKLIERLIEEVKLWQNEFKLKYAELYAEDDLNRIAPWCAKTGEMMQRILTSEIPRLDSAISDVMGSEHSQCAQMYTQFRGLCTSLYRRTFVVTEQSDWNVKKSISRPLSVKLRILGADSQAGLGGIDVYAVFVQEKHIIDCFHRESGFLDINSLKEKSSKFKSGQRAKFVRHSTITEGRFNNIEMCLNLTRTKDLPVFEEKYRLIFYTQLEKEMYWTMSLPMVVTTGASQQVQCLASIMWQCFSTDVFDIPAMTPQDLPWSTVVEILQRKIRNLPSCRCMAVDNLLHLKKRLIGTADSANAEAADNAKISLHQFCNTLLEKPASDCNDSTSATKVGFTFWEWFLSIYNLIGLPRVVAFWKKGWLDGFLSKEMAEKKLKESNNHKPGTFLLRFSDWHIRRSQGKDAVFGMVAPTLLWISSGEKAVYHMELIGYDELKELPLANILLNTNDRKGYQLYRYFYPEVDSPCEQLLKGYTGLGPTIPGYTGLTKSFIANLEKVEQNFIKLELRGKRTMSCSPETGPKKAKGALTATVPSIQPEPQSLATTNIREDMLTEAQSVYCGVPIKMIPCKTGSFSVSHKNTTDMPSETYTGGTQTSIPMTLLPTVIRDSNYNVNQNYCNIQTKTAEAANSQSQNICSSDSAIQNHKNNGKNSSDLYKTIPATLTCDRQHDQSDAALVQDQSCTSRVNLSSVNMNKSHLPLLPTPQLQSHTYTADRISDNIEAGNGSTLRPGTGEFCHRNNTNTVREDEQSCNAQVTQNVIVAENCQRRSDACTTMKMIKDFLADLPADTLMTLLPPERMAEMMAPCLQDLSPECRQKVTHSLHVTMTRSQSSIDSLKQRHLTVKNIPDSDPSGLYLSFSDIEAGLSLTEDEILPIAENIETFDLKDTIAE